MNYKQLAQKYKTPYYLYDKQEIISNIKQLHQIDNVYMNYATKANNNIEILKIIKEYNMKVDATGIGEVFVNQYAGFDNDDIYVVCNNLDYQELELLLKEDILISVDSFDQLKTIKAISPTFNKLMLRINSSFGCGENAQIITGGNKQKFGIDLDILPDVLEYITNSQLTLVGINQHIGSLNLDYNDFVRACNQLLQIITDFKLNNLSYINFGGGFGVNYKRHINNQFFDFKAFNTAISPILLKFRENYFNPDVIFMFEPGRFVVATSGVLVGEVTSIKHRGDQIFVGTNLGFNNMIRPTLYDSYHRVEFITENQELSVVNVVGNLCESGDYIARERKLPLPNIGDLVVVHDTGAYGYSMSNNYNSRLRPIELMQDKGSIKVIRSRETLQDLIKQ